MSKSIDQLVIKLADYLKEYPWCFSFWESGSAAFSLDDSYSDRDLILYVAKGFKEKALHSAKEWLKKQSPFTAYHRVPEPSWHGHSQFFAQLEAYGPWQFIDFVFVEEGEIGELLNSTRHGVPKLFFDRVNLLKGVSSQPLSFQQKRETRKEEIKEFFPFIYKLVQKECEREKYIDAFHFYTALLMRYFVENLRIHHCPDRYDFGLRYLDRDLPREWVEKIDLWLRVDSIEAIKKNSTEIFSCGLNIT